MSNAAKRLGFIIITTIAAAFAVSYLMPDEDREHARVAVGDKHFSVEVVSTPEARARGLSGRPSLAEGTGMLFIFEMEDRYGFWMKDMHFPIDIVWIRANSVVGFALDVAPEPGKSIAELAVHYPLVPVSWVLELPAGTVRSAGLRVGDSVSLPLPL